MDVRSVAIHGGFENFVEKFHASRLADYPTNASGEIEESPSANSQSGDMCS